MGGDRETLSVPGPCMIQDPAAGTQVVEVGWGLKKGGQTWVDLPNVAQ